LVAILIYVFGYISLTSYLQSFGINENIGLDLKIIKLGTLYSIIIAPVVFLSYSTFKIGDYSNSVPDVSKVLIDSLHDALGYTIIYSITLGGLLFNYSFDTPTVILLIVFVIAFCLNKIKINVHIMKLLKSYLLIVPIFALTFCLFKSEATGKYLLYVLQFGVFFSCCGLRIFNKEGITFQMSHIGFAITTLLIAITLFGRYLIIKVPIQYGGELRKLSTYYLDSVSVEKIKHTPLYSYIKKDNSIIVHTVYENADKLFFQANKNVVLSIPKSYITIEEIKIQ